MDQLLICITFVVTEQVGADMGVLTEAFVVFLGLSRRLPGLYPDYTTDTSRRRVSYIAD
jgi:hypothetical protein